MLQKAEEINLVERFASALADDQSTLSGALRALLPEGELQALKQTLKPGTPAAGPDRRLLQFLGPVSAIPRKGIAWKGKAARAANLPNTATLTVAPDAGVRASLRVLPGPSYELKGSPGIAVGLKAPLPVGQISLSGQRSVRNSLLMKFSHPEDTRVLEALYADLPVLAKLKDPASLLASENFKSVKLTTSGKVLFGAKLKAGRSWMQSFDSAGGAVATRLKASADYTMKWERTGDFRFTMSRARGGHVRIWLTESRKNRDARSLSMGAEVEIKGLRQSVAPVMKEIARLPDRLDGIVKTYSRPSRLFRDALRERLSASDPSLRALVDVVAGGGKPAVRRFVNSLVDAMVDSAGASADHWSDLFAGRIDRVVEDALDTASLPPDRRDKLARHVENKVREALDDFDESLLKDLEAALRADAKPITATLTRYAEGPAAVARRLDASAESCLAHLKQLLAEYRTLEERIAKAVETAEKERLTMRYGRAVSRSKTASTLLRLCLDPRTEEGKSLYKQMIEGDFSDAMTAGMDDDNDTVTLETCVFKRAFQRKVTSGLTFNLFGREIASRRALSTQIKAEHGIGGQINLLEAEADISEEHTAFGEGQSMQVGSLIHFLTTPDAPDAFTVKLVYTDRNMKPAELREYLASLEDAALIGQGATRRVMEMENALGARERGRRSMQIDTALELSRHELLQAGNNDEDEIIRIAIEEQLKSYRRIRWADDALGRLADAPGGDLPERLFAWRDYSRVRIRRTLGIRGTRLSKTERHVLYLVRGILDRADELSSFVAHWRELGRIGRSVGSDAERLKDTTLNEIRDLHADMIADLNAWVDARNWIVGRSREDLSPVAAAFLASLRRLCSVAAEPLIPVISWTEENDTRRVAVM